MSRINNHNYTDTLLKQTERLFHTQDLGVLWGIKNQQTLYTTISRYTKKGVLTPLHKGLYTTITIDQLDPYQLGVKALHSYAYVSCETMLMSYGMINSNPPVVTLISTYSRYFQIGQHHYRSRRLQDQFLYNAAGIKINAGILVATPERAIADMLYFNPRAHFDGLVDWKTVQKLQTLIGYPLTPHRYANSKS